MKFDIWSVGPGQRVPGILETYSYRSAIRAGIPVVVVRGTQEGPTITVMACQHGRELNGIESIRRAINQIDPRKLKGRAIFIPCANPIAARIRQQDFPHERGRYLSAAQGGRFNLNRGWPGNPEGTLQEQMADVMWREAISRSSVCIDLHGWTGLSSSLVWGVLPDADLVRAFGLGIYTLKRESDMKKDVYTENACWAAGIRCVTAELVPQKVLREESVSAGTRGILNVMRKIGMLEGELELPPQQIELDDAVQEDHKEYALKAEFQGLLVSRMPSPPFLVKAGEVFAEVVDFDNVLHTQHIKSPIDGVVFNLGGVPWGEDMAETSVKDEGELVALVKSYRRIVKS